jgi:hypothetical protein
MNTNKFSWSKVALRVLGKKAVQNQGDGYAGTRARHRDAAYGGRLQSATTNLPWHH